METGAIAGENTIKKALCDFFQANALGDDGGVNDKWVKLQLGPIVIPFPNTKARKEAVKYHDIHHIVTGYPTTWRGEAEVGAWEIATGCGDYRAAWIFDLGIFALGLFLFPRAVFRAFIRGRRSLNFFHHTYPYQQILQMGIYEAQAKLNLHKATDVHPENGEIIDFTLWGLLAMVTSLVIFVAPIAIPIVYFIHFYHC